MKLIGFIFLCIILLICFFILIFISIYPSLNSKEHVEKKSLLCSVCEKSHNLVQKLLSFYVKFLNLVPQQYLTWEGIFSLTGYFIRLIKKILKVNTLPSTILNCYYWNNFIHPSKLLIRIFFFFENMSMINYWSRTKSWNFHIFRSFIGMHTISCPSACLCAFSTIHHNFTVSLLQ